MITRIKRHVKALLTHAGLSVRPLANVKPLDLTNHSDMHPLTAVYGAQGRAVLLRVPLAKCIHFNWLAFPCSRESRSPFVRTLVDLEAGLCDAFEGSPLETFYAAFQPQNAAALMGLENPSCRLLQNIPPSGAPWLWRQDSPEHNVVTRRSEILAENREHGVPYDHHDGDPFFGPVSARKGALEFRRLMAIREALKTHGLHVDTSGINNIRVICLYSAQSNDWRYAVATSGQHRIAAWSALGHDDIVVELVGEGLGGIVRREDVANWPVVERGYLNKTEATATFDRLFAALPPRLYGEAMSVHYP